MGRVPVIASPARRVSERRSRHWREAVRLPPGGVYATRAAIVAAAVISRVV